VSTSKKKTKRLRQANYVAAGLAGATSDTRGASVEAAPQPAARYATHPDFDYTHIRRDLRRIGLLAGLCVSTLVVLSFFIR
jgi:hypothetical protein